jgi:hypothetical protein
MQSIQANVASWVSPATHLQRNAWSSHSKHRIQDILDIASRQQAKHRVDSLSQISQQKRWVFEGKPMKMALMGDRLSVEFVKFALMPDASSERWCGSPYRPMTSWWAIGVGMPFARQAAHVRDRLIHLGEAIHATSQDLSTLLRRSRRLDLLAGSAAMD